ncbi:MAG: sugar ABC transporter permease [Actinobacteria bacterium]|jgi:alpha-glucoside transport system permease protein|nr:sugar ABC transporter permease [Acidimicrobiaceae bacterium]MBP6486805.1 sugar ABC transporter permease [Ilumatobacteraceae bacterium]NMD25826.1 sugar ABC transporter permease [Actinomycetota bacterium]MBP7890302.1 sugar ABC transporter permease [Ilumatobacteraceae bacterium]MBP8208771.1 sugar ABC transporter permease [Ilumatobacteraceae bacterium]
MLVILKTLLTVGAGILVFAAILGVLYWLASQLHEPWRERARVAVFVGPAIVLLTGLVLPAIINLRFSFNDRNDDWYGFRNYVDIFTDEDNLLVMRNTLWWGVMVTLASTVMGVIIARYADRMRGEPVAKALIFLPTAISMVGAGVIWNFVYSPKEYGLLNSMYQLLPGEQKTQFFLQENTFFGIENNFIPGINTFFIMIVVIWIQAGFSTVVISAALKGVPDDLVEAARIDGATDRQAFYKVVLPYIKGTIITVATTTTIAVLKIFDIIQTMGKGGSFGTSTIANEMYEQGFPQDNEGLGAAWAVLLFLLVVPIVFVNARNQKAMREAR